MKQEKIWTNKMTKATLWSNVENDRVLTEINRKEYLAIGIKLKDLKDIIIETEEQCISLVIDQKQEVKLMGIYKRTVKPSLVEGCATYYKIS